MAHLNDLSGRNKGKGRDIISVGPWEVIVKAKVDEATKQAKEGIDKQVALDLEVQGSRMSKRAWNEALRKAREGR